MAVTHYTNSTSWSKLNGKAIPHPDFPMGGQFDDAEDYPPKNAWSCVAFAKLMSKYLFNDYNYGTTIDQTKIDSEADAKKFITGLTKGSRLKGHKSNGTSHTMIVLGHNNDGKSCNVYHANWPDSGNPYAVNISKFTYADFDSYYSHASAAKA